MSLGDRCPRCQAGGPVAHDGGWRCSRCGYAWRPPDDPRGHEPAELAVFVGSFDGPAHRVRWDGDLLHYERFGPELEQEERYGLHPGPDAWRAFWDALERAGAWGWGEYDDDEESAHDIQWALQAGHAGSWVSASGEGRFPPDGAAEPTAEFGMLCDAVRALLGGMPFGDALVRRPR